MSITGSKMIRMIINSGLLVFLLYYSHIVVKWLVLSLGFTPVDALKKGASFTAYVNMIITAPHNRTYPYIKVGDQVEVYRQI